MKVLFIIPPYIEFDSFVNPKFNERTVPKGSKFYGSAVTDMPLGVLSLSSYIKKHSDSEVELMDLNIILNKAEDFNYNSFSELFYDVLSEKKWKDYLPDIIGISTLFTTSYFNMIEIARTSRELFPNSLILAGGGVPTNMYKNILKGSKSFDALCYGEGEKPLLGLINSEDKKRFLKESTSWITKEKVNQVFQHDFIEDLDEIPFYDYGLLDTKDYEISPTLNSYNSFINKGNLFHISTSRGCPHNCCFCSSHTIHGKKMRYHSLNRVKEDLKNLKENYNANKVGIQDDNFMVNKDRAEEIIYIAKDLKMGIFFQSGLPLYALDIKMLKLIKSVGINHLVLAIESGSDRVLKDIMHKPLNTPMIREVVSNCHNLRIETDANILIGLPGETKKDIEDTRRFLKELDVNWLRIYIATPLIGSEMFDICVKNNYLSGNHIGSDFKKAVISTEDFTADYIREKVYSLNLELNFVENSDVKLGNYKLALKGFENTIKVKNNHAFAYYFASRCYRELGMEEESLRAMEKYYLLVESSKMWRDYAIKFKLPLEVVRG